MERVAEFKKVSFDQFKSGYMKCFGEADGADACAAYERIRLPERATSGSAGYDFFSTADVTIGPGESLRIPTGIRCLMSDGWVLLLFPRSGLGFKYRFQLDNTVGVVDSDYAGSDNEGHIFIAVTNDSRKQITLTIKEGEAFAQGILLPFGVTFNDNVTVKRNGGFGSTTEK